MIEVTKYRDKLVGVFGLGITGQSVLKSLKLGGSRIVAWDDNEKTRSSLLGNRSPGIKNLKLDQILADIEDPRWQEIEALILSPGVPLFFPKPHIMVENARRLGVPIICDIELLYNSCSTAKYIGITGTNGKSTTTSLIGHILKESGHKTQVGGNIGTPALELDRLNCEGTYVLEMSSFQLELIDKMHFNSSVFINFSADHLDRHGDLENYLDAKLNIFNEQNKGDIAVLSIDNPKTKECFEKLQSRNRIGKIIPISAEEKIEGGVFVSDNVIYDKIDKKRKIKFKRNNFLLGKHNSENIAAAVAICHFYDWTDKQIASALESYVGLKHRMEYITEKNKITFINDSKATNAESAEKALNSFKDILWIAGGRQKKEGISSITNSFKNIRHAFLIGEAQDNFAKTLEQEKISYTRCTTLEKAFEEATKMAKRKNVILLSPACSSYDQWKNFEKRGEAFRKLVLDYIAI